MSQPSRNRLTIRRAMGVIGVLAVVLALFATSRDDAEVVASLLLASLVIVVPLHLAIEGNRRDTMISDARSAARADAEGSANSLNEASQRTGLPPSAELGQPGDDAERDRQAVV